MIVSTIPKVFECKALWLLLLTIKYSTLQTSLYSYSMQKVNQSEVYYKIEMIWFNNICLMNKMNRKQVSFQTKAGGNTE